jgi:hypothetical protein
MSGNWIAGPLLDVVFIYVLAGDRLSAIAPDAVAARRAVGRPRSSRALASRTAGADRAPPPGAMREVADRC